MKSKVLYNIADTAMFYDNMVFAVNQNMYGWGSNS